MKINIYEIFVLSLNIFDDERQGILQDRFYLNLRVYGCMVYQYSSFSYGRYREQTN